MIDWNRLKNQHEAILTVLRGLMRDKHNISHQIPLLQKNRKTAKLEYKNALKKAIVMKNKIHELSRNIKRCKEEWFALGDKFTEKNLFLNIEACNYLIEFEELNKVRRKVIFDDPKRTEEIYKKKARQCTLAGSQLRALKSQILDLQKKLSDLEIVWLLDDYKELDGTHSYQQYCRVSRYQLSLKREKLYKTHSFNYCKYEGKWCIITAGERGEVCEQEEIELIETLIDEANSKRSRV